MELNWRKARLLTLAFLLTLLSNAYCSSKSGHNKEQKEEQKKEQEQCKFDIASGRQTPSKCQ